MARFLFLLLAVYAFGVLMSCRKKCNDPRNIECENYNPCFGKKAVSADFIIEELIYDPELQKYFSPYETDTTIGQDVRFTAKEENATYKWIIGAKEYDKKVVHLNFGSAPRETSIPITLIVTKEPDKACFPKDDGVDTFTKNLYIAKSTIISGSFQGYYLGKENDIFTITLTQNKIYDSVWLESALYAENLVKGCSSFLSDRSIYGYRKQFFTGYSNECYGAMGGIYFSRDNTIQINFQLHDPTMPEVFWSQRTFIGRKIN